MFMKSEDIERFAKVLKRLSVHTSRVSCQIKFFNRVASVEELRHWVSVATVVKPLIIENNL